MALFKSANAAVRFAVNYGNAAHIARSAMNKSADTTSVVDSEREKGDAGTILKLIKRTGEFHEACLVARCALHKIPCSCGAPCCSKHKPNWEWYEAINYISLEAKRLIDLERKDETRGIKDDPAMRRALVAKFFGDRVRINELALACEVADKTVFNHNSRITKILKKTEGEAWSLLDEYLRTAEII